MRRPPATRRAPARSLRKPRRRSRPVPVFDPGSMNELLTGASTTLSCSLIPEPQLLFGGKSPCEDPKTGLTGYGPYSKTDATRRPIIRLGIVGPAEAIDRARTLVERMTTAIPHHEKNDAMLHPGFPGVNDQDPFQTQFVTQNVWCKTLSPAGVARIENHPDFTVRIQLLIEDVTREVMALSKLDTPPDVVLIAMTAGLEKRCRVGIAQYDREQQQNDDENEEDSPADVTEELDENTTDEEEDDDEEPVSTARSFRRGLKAACMHLLPTQLLWHRTLAGTKGVQDLATRAWNLSVALLYKARVIPWRLADAIDGSCFVGISFFHADHQPNTTRTSIAQAFTHTGEGFVLQGDKFTWQPTREERSPHLDKDGAAALMKQVLDVYEEEVHALPQRVIIHKNVTVHCGRGRGIHLRLAGRAGLRIGHALPARDLLPATREQARTARHHHRLRRKERTRLHRRVHPVPAVLSRFSHPTIIGDHGESWQPDVPRRRTDLLRLTKLNWNTAAFSCV